MTQDVWPGADGLARDGRVVRVRLLEPGDAEQLLELHERMSEKSLRFRFFSVSRDSAPPYVRHLLDEEISTITLVAASEDGLVAVGSAEQVDEETMEVAFLVAEGEHGRGLGSLLLAHLAARARDRGVRRFVADVLGTNVEMRRVFLQAGFDVTVTSAAGVSTLVVDLTLTRRSLEAIDAREEEAEIRSLGPLLDPGSVVVIGVRRNGSGVGAAVLAAIQQGQYAGRVDVVHPKGGEVAGLRASVSCLDLPTRPDLAVIAVPAVQAVVALRDVASAGIPTAVVVSSGFGELGEEGARLQRELRAVARRHSVRLVGPNCLGVMHHGPMGLLNATFSSSVPEPGRVAVASQSGGVGIVLLEAARRTGLGIGAFVSLGNKADVSGNDLLAAWLHDPSVGVACLYLESFGNAHKFARLARRFARVKPLLAVVGGRSEGGRRAGASHTAAAASDAVAVDALLASTGAIRCDGADDMAATALLLDQQPAVRGRRLGIVTNAGGIGVLAADLASASGLQVPGFSPELGERLTRALSASAGWSNPVDTGAGATPSQLVDAVREVCQGGEVDSVLVVVVATALLDVRAVLDNLAEMRPSCNEVPLVLVLLGSPDDGRDLAPDITVMDSYETAVHALARSAERSEWLRQVEDEGPAGDPERRESARAMARRSLDAAADGGWLGWPAVGQLIRPYGLELTGEIADDADSAATAGIRQGFPVAAKVSSLAGSHKTEGGLVRVGISDEPALREVVSAWEDEFGGALEVVVQEMAEGVELAVGLVRDPVVGPLLMVAAGGVHIDVWNDRAFLLAPASPADAERALRGLRLWPLLAGHRGSAPADVAALVRVLVAVSTLAVEVPEVQELDLNPVVVSASGCALVDARLRLAPATPLRGDAPELG
jgi:acyl-CoA synthetase (NDP forming)/GNAT superfamily N-acetyltransferase